MVTTLLLMRHGVTQSNMKDIYMGRSDEDVSPEGYHQIDKLSLRLKKVPIAAIYSSPLKEHVPLQSVLPKITILKVKFLPI